MNKLKPAEYYHSLSDGYNNGNSTTIVPYEVILFNNGIICKKSPHPVVASHMLVCAETRTSMLHEHWPFGFEFTTFHYVHADHEKRIDFMENQFSWIKDKTEIIFEACSDLKIGDKQYPRFRDKVAVFRHCMNLMEKEFNIPAENNTNRCIKHVI